MRFALVVRHGTGFMRLKSKEGLSVNIGTSTMEAGSRREGGREQGRNVYFLCNCYSLERN